MPGTWRAAAGVSASSSRAISPARPVKLAVSRGRDLVAAAAAAPGASSRTAARTSEPEARPRAAATNSARAGSLSPSASASSCAVSLWAVPWIPLQVTHRPRAQARRLGQLFLRQPGLRPQLSQQSREPQARLISHRRPNASRDRTRAGKRGQRQDLRAKPMHARPPQPARQHQSADRAFAGAQIHVGCCVANRVW
jgi:hypothetical protein